MTFSPTGMRSKILSPLEGKAWQSEESENTMMNNKEDPSSHRRRAQ